MKKKILMKVIFLILFSVNFIFAEGVEQIGNNDFESGLNGWEFYSQNPDYASYKLDTNSVISGTNSVQVNVITPYKSYPSGKIALFTKVAIDSGSTYAVSFKIRSNKVIDGNGIWWSLYDSLETANYYNGMWGQVLFGKDTTIMFKDTIVTNFTNPKTDFSIDLAAIGVDSVMLWIDDVSFEKVVPPNPNLPTGSGTEADPYQIATLGNLAWVTQNYTAWNSYLVQTADIYAAETETWDYDDDNGDGDRFNDPNDSTTEGSNDGWLPIGGEFQGVYDGAGFEINGLTMNKVSKNIGLFNTIKSSTIKNVGLANINIKGTEYIGGLAGTCYGNLIENCYVTGTITSDSTHQRIGGLFGYISGSTVNVVIRNCYTDVEILGAKKYAGGFIGNIKGVATTLVEKCYSSGSIIDSKESIGGFIGKAESPVDSIVIDQCYTTSNVNSGKYSGGFIGYAKTSASKGSVVISNSYSLGEITQVEGDASTFIGGFCGYNNAAIIKNSYTISSIGFILPDTTITRNGFVGKAKGTVVSCYFDSISSNQTTSHDALGKSTEEMKNVSTFTDWDFSSVWEIKDNYPNLINNSNPDLAPQQVEPSLVGQWDFDDATNLTVATVGSALELVGTATVVDGPENGNGAVSIGVGNYFKAITGIEPNGGGTKVNTYTLSIDFKVDAFVGYVSLIQTDPLNSSGNDGDLFLNRPGIVGAGGIGYSNKIIDEETWYRMVVVRNTHKADSVTTDIYLNGELAYSGNPVSIDGRLGLDNTVLLFADNDGEDNLINVAKVALYNYALTGQEVTDLGGFVKEVLPEGKELIVNGSFDDGLNNWDFFSLDTTYAKYNLDVTGVITGANSVHVKVDTSYNSYPSGRIQLGQHGLNGGIVKGGKYFISFKIKSTKSLQKCFWTVYKEPGYANNVGWGWVSLKKDTIVTIVDTLDATETNSNVYLALDFAALEKNDVELWIDDVHMIEIEGTVGVNKNETVPTVFLLEQNYPNPFNPTTKINFALPKTSDVKLSVYNIIGEKVATLVNSNLIAGNHSVSFNASGLASGIYVYRITAGDFVSVKKMMLLK